MDEFRALQPRRKVGPATSSRGGVHVRWFVEKMLDLLKDETARIDSRFQELIRKRDFLAPVLQRNLAAIELKFGKSDFERRRYALLS